MGIGYVKPLKNFSPIFEQALRKVIDQGSLIITCDDPNQAMALKNEFYAYLRSVKANSEDEEVVGMANRVSISWKRKSHQFTIKDNMRVGGSLWCIEQATKEDKRELSNRELMDIPDPFKGGESEKG